MSYARDVVDCNNGTRLHAFATFLCVAINFHSARDPFFSFFRTIEINCLTARKGGDISERKNLGADTVAWFSEHVLCSLFSSSSRTFGGNACFLLDSHRLYLWYRVFSPLHVTAPAAILRIAPSRKCILRPQLRVQAILLLNILRAWEPAPGERVSTKWYSVCSQADCVYTRFTYTWYLNILNYRRLISNDNYVPALRSASYLHCLFVFSVTHNHTVHDSPR